MGDFKQGGTVARDRDWLKIPGKIPANLSAQCFSTWSETPLGPAAFLWLTVCCMHLTSCSFTVRVMLQWAAMCCISASCNTTSKRVKKAFSSSTIEASPSAALRLVLWLVMCWTPCHICLLLLLSRWSSNLLLLSSFCLTDTSIQVSMGLAIESTVTRPENSVPPL